ncbi:MAG: hypothetical protein JO192_00945 [Candidatus Eremiobacteraeota bacterium]|nr:hypothetical protein [Candidatus Eremiobacteraeota bacterium]
MIIRISATALGLACFLSTAGTSAASDPLAKWFGASTCPALDGLYSKTPAPSVKTGAEDMQVTIPASVLPKLKQSMTVPWYVYDAHSHAALSHVGGDSSVVWTLRIVEGPPPEPLPYVDLSAVRTTSGLKLGSSASSVVQKLGKPRIISACGMERYEYNDTSDLQAEDNDLDFTIRDGRVIEIVHTSWG